MERRTHSVEIGNPSTFPDENPYRNYKTLSVILSIIIVDLLKNISELVVSSMIVKNEPDFYENSWKVQAAVITTFMVSIISTFTEIIAAIIIPFLRSSRGSNELYGKGNGSLIFVAHVFSMICTFIAWEDMWDHPLGKAFCILVGIVQPSIFFIFIVLALVFILVEE